MIKKQFVKSRNVTKVTFELPADFEADAVHLLADFNDWQPEAFNKLKNGKWQLVKEITPEARYEFRYMVEQNGERQWLNDPDADATVPNDQGTENAVLHS
jgi:1,4-alpha-glucan branching enzyme